MEAPKHSKPCCTIPPAQATYTEKGEYITIQGMKTYRTGSPTATTAILIIFDIFGFRPQTLQGADILANATNTHQYQVFMPDFFFGKPAGDTWYPPDTPEKQKLLGEFLSGPANPANTVAKIPLILKDLKAAAPSVTKLAVLGMCWGGKIVALSSQAGSPFSAAASVHPALIDPEDAKKVTIPTCILASGDEDQTALKAFEEALTVPKYVETYSDQVHGWMAARADFENPRTKSEFERGYQKLIDFYHEHL